MASLANMGHTHGENLSREPRPVYENPTAARAMRLVPLPGALVGGLTFAGLYVAGGELLISALYGAGFAGVMILAAFLAVRIAVVPRARLRVFERVFETKSPRIKHQGMHIVEVEASGKYVFITTESEGMLAVLCGEPEKAREALLELRKRAKET